MPKIKSFQVDTVELGQNPDLQSNIVHDNLNDTGINTHSQIGNHIGDLSQHGAASTSAEDITILGNIATREWTNRTTPSDNVWLSIAWSPDLELFAAVAQSSTGSPNYNCIMTSPDGINWTERTSLEPILVTIAWGNPGGSPDSGLFVAIYLDTVVTSSDGITWTTSATVDNVSWNGVTFGGAVGSPAAGLFVAVSSSGTNRVMTSPDGVNWTNRTAASQINWRSVAWSPDLGIFVACADTATLTNIMTSPDGIVWTSRTSATTNKWWGIVWSPELSLFAASSISGTGDRIQTSPDGIVWTSQTTPADNFWYTITWSPELNLFAAASGTGTNRLMTSHDGIKWILRIAPVQLYRGIAWSPELGIFAACSITGTLNRIVTSL